MTQKKVYWVMPNGVKEVQCAPVKEINFIGKKGSGAAKLTSLDLVSTIKWTKNSFSLDLLTLQCESSLWR